MIWHGFPTTFFQWQGIEPWNMDMLRDADIKSQEREDLEYWSRREGVDWHQLEDRMEDEQDDHPKDKH